MFDRDCSKALSGFRALSTLTSLTCLTCLTWLLALPFVALSAGCDEPKATAPEAAPPPTVATNTTAPSAIPSATATPPVKKRAKRECTPAATVDFQGNAALENEARRKARKDAGSLTPADLKTITSLNLTQAPVHELDPCIIPLFTGLKDLFLAGGELDDLSPIATLTSLVSLRSADNKVTDLAPLEKLVRLDRLDLSHTGVTDIKSIALLVNLTELQLDGTNVTDLGPLKSCTKLEKLSIQQTAVRDISPLRDLMKLRMLHITGSPIQDVSAVSRQSGNGLKIVTK